jgi:hypothetical protein
MEDLLFNISPEWILMFSINFILIFILFLMNLANRSKLKKLKAKYNKFMNGVSGENVEHLLEECIERIEKVNANHKDIENQINSIERNLMQCVQKVGVVRFNAFDNVGSDLSYSIALLDSNETGVILSGLYARDSSATFAKPVVGGKSKYPMSAEELKALDIAKKASNERTYIEKGVV